MGTDEESGLDSIIRKNKKVIYSLTSDLVNNQFNNKLYYLLLIIEVLQVLAYQCHEVYQYKGWGSQQFRKITQFINPQYYLKHSILMDVIIPLSTFVILIHVLILGYCFRQQQKKINVQEKPSVQREQGKKGSIFMIGHWCTVVFTTVLTTPVFLPSLLVFYCHQQSPYHQHRRCYTTYHIFLIILSIINIIWTLIINIYYALFYYTFNPFKHKNVFAISSPLFNVLKLIIKVVPPGYFIFDQTLQYNILAIFGIAAGLLGYTAISRILYPYRRYNLTDDRVILHIEVISIFISIMFILQAFFNEQQGFIICFIVSFIVPFPIANAAHKFILNNKKKSILKINEFEKDNTENIQQLISYLIVQLENSSIQKNYHQFLKVIKLHHEKCQNTLCSCHQYIKNYEQQVIDNEVQKQQIYKVLIQIIDKMLLVNKKAYSLLILKSYIQFYQLKNAIKSAFILSKILNQKISFFENYLIDAFLYQIKKTYRDLSNAQIYRLFSQHLMIFENQTIKIAKNYAQFWQELTEQNSSLKKIMNLMKSTQNSKKVIHQEFQILHSIYPQNLHVLDIYKQLFKQVLMDYEQFMRYNTLYEDNNVEKERSKLTKADRHIKFSPNQDLIVINTSVNVSNDIFHGGCEMISVTNNVHKILGYSSHQLIGKNINRFLPKIYTDFHDQIITNYLNKKDSQLKTRQLVVFPVNSSGNLLECAMVAKIMPSLQYGVNIVSFLLNNSKSHKNLIIYDQRTGLVDSMSEKAQKLLLGKKSKKNSISIPDHINDILPVWDYQNQKIKKNHQWGSKQIQLSYADIHLYRSDGPKSNKYVKVITFQLEFQTRIFTINSMDTNKIWHGFQTLVQNTPNQANLLKENSNENEVSRNFLSQSANPIIKKMMDNMQIAQKSDQKMYKSLQKCYPKVYIVVQLVFVLGLLGLIIWNYAGTLVYYSTLEDDILIKENIADSKDLVIESSHDVSHFVYSGGDSIIKNQVNVQNALSQLKQLQSVGQFIYQQIVKKEQSGEFSISDLMLQVSYYGSASNVIKKQQTVTDASFQFVLYLIEIYKNSDPINILPNNIQFVFKNGLNISDKFNHLNEVFTQNLLKNSVDRKSFIISIFASIMALFFTAMLWDLILKLVITSKVNDVIKIYENVPTSQLQKFPLKCENFIKYVCPIEKDQKKLSNKNIGLLKSKKKIQAIKENKQPYQLLQQEQQVEYISFSSNLSVKNVIVQTIGFLVVFSALFIVHLTYQNSVIQKNFTQVAEWNRIRKFKGNVLELVYLMNEHQNRVQQWNSTELFVIKNRFNDSISAIELLIKETTGLDSYLSSTFQLLEQSVFILNSKNITSQQFVLNQNRFHQLLETVNQQQIHSKIKPNIASTINRFLSLLQLIFIAQLVIFLLYAILYLPKSYKNFIQKNQISQLMFKTLGYKLQNVAHNHSKNK